MTTFSGGSEAISALHIGVPQGSILGPLFYIVYVNDIYTALSCKPRLFADDTCLFLSSPTYFFIFI